jgi:hypothetical protein
MMDRWLACLLGCFGGGLCWVRACVSWVSRASERSPSPWESGGGGGGGRRLVAEAEEAEMGL